MTLHGYEKMSELVSSWKIEIAFAMTVIVRRSAFVWTTPELLTHREGRKRVRRHRGNNTAAATHRV